MAIVYLAKSREIIIFASLSLSLYLLEIALSVDFSQSWYIILLELDLYAGLILWHIGVGILAPYLRRQVWGVDDGDIPKTMSAQYDDPEMEQSAGFLPHWIRFGIPLLITVEVLLLVGWLNTATTGQYLLVACYILGPSLILYFRHWILTLLAVLWVWFPIEFGVLDAALGHLSLSLLPLDALLGIFSLLWPLLLHGRHISWYRWSVSRADLMLVGKVSGVLTLIIVPLGILTNFLTINPQNFLHPDLTVTDNRTINIVVYCLLIFYLIFVVQGLMEETLFRDVIFKHQYFWLQEQYQRYRWKNVDLGHVMIGLAGILVATIPFWDNILRALSALLPVLQGITDQVGSLSHPLGTYEGRPIAAIAGLPVWPFYLLVAGLLVILGLFLYHYHHTPLIAALVTSAMVFGFAHFEDFRYVFFAAIAGFGYGLTYYRTKNLVASAMVHMGVDAIWALLLSY